MTLGRQVPQEAGVDERSDKTARCSVYVNVDIDVALDEEVVNGLDVFVLAGICGSKNST